ncbi:hypothetical protein GCM10020369_58560 [Cryptosporangium minutisporangium]|uniref:ATP/GTP-binding protein n=1 Tax=Cryptosporangium minutisporangium TaxID=113569 RepID=A0ABP6T675_9ACTN
MGLPAWFWVPAGWWAARSASASVPGLTVTATAVPAQVVWETGDGSRVVCQGPGTPWRPGMDASKPSPDCGHTYARPSSAEPGGVFRLTVTVQWRVTWAGGGQSGAVPALGTSSTTTLRVGESEALLTPQR